MRPSRPRPAVWKSATATAPSGIDGSSSPCVDSQDSTSIRGSPSVTTALRPGPPTPCTPASRSAGRRRRGAASSPSPARSGAPSRRGPGRRARSTAPRASSSPRRETSRASSPSAMPSATASSRLISKNGRSCFSTHARLAHRHRRRVVVVERPAGREDERELRVGRLDRRLVLDREEPPAATRERGRRRVEVRRARIVEVGARPLHAVLLDPRVADPVPVRAEVGELVPDVLGRLVLGPGRRRAPSRARSRSASPRAPRRDSRAPCARGSRAARCS